MHHPRVAARVEVDTVVVCNLERVDAPSAPRAAVHVERLRPDVQPKLRPTSSWPSNCKLSTLQQHPCAAVHVEYSLGELQPGLRSTQSWPSNRKESTLQQHHRAAVRVERPHPRVVAPEHREERQTFHIHFQSDNSSTRARSSTLPGTRALRPMRIDSATNTNKARGRDPVERWSNQRINKR